MALVSLRQLLALKQCPLSARIGLNALEQLGWRQSCARFAVIYGQVLRSCQSFTSVMRL